jgi:hypothetical protein
MGLISYLNSFVAILCHFVIKGNYLALFAPQRGRRICDKQAIVHYN